MTTMKIVLVSAVLVLGLAVTYTPAESAKFDAPFGILLEDSTCPEATYILKHPCPDAGTIAYLTFPKSKATDLAQFLGQNVAIRGTVHDSTCSAPLVQVSKISISPVLPPCAAP
jgi:hypothetical protein